MRCRRRSVDSFLVCFPEFTTHINAEARSRNVCHRTAGSSTATRQTSGPQSNTISVHSRLCRFLQNRLSFEVVTFLQAGLLADNPVGGFLNHGVQFVGVPYEEAAGVAFFAGG
jgi:hypothetical protein